MTSSMEYSSLFFVLANADQADTFRYTRLCTALQAKRYLSRLHIAGLLLVRVSHGLDLATDDRSCEEGRHYTYPWSTRLQQLIKGFSYSPRTEGFAGKKKGLENDLQALKR
ncbi:MULTISPECIES: hypothetical protein [unclassified Pseudomonas]|uniref:hypothetical protein n=2 Tax=unclassified Pseudomonas TaxID=196821 RepID=UPI00117AE573